MFRRLMTEPEGAKELIESRVGGRIDAELTPPG